MSNLSREHAVPRLTFGLLALPFMLSGCATDATAARAQIAIPFVCANADIAFIGKVLSVDTRDDEDPYGFISYVDFDVERSVLGTTGPSQTVVVRGGAIGSQREYVSGYPFPKVGQRYAFALSAENAVGDRSIVHWKRLQHDSPLPSQQEIDATVQSECQ